MRIVHTGDWHLGRHFGPMSLLPDQSEFVDWFIRQVAEQKADLVVIAGDVFDRAVPATDALSLYTDTLRRLAELSVTVAIIAGNHDSPERVALYDTLLDPSAIYVRGGYGSIGEVIPLDFPDGRLDLVMLPFLDPQRAPDDLPVMGDESGDSDDAFQRRIRRSHESVLASAIGTARSSLTADRSLAVAHAYVRNCTVSDSERQLTLGGAGTVPGGLFAPFSYTALGHLHTPQWVGGDVGSGRARYSGTPLAYSFSEVAPKSISVVDLSPRGQSEVTELLVPVGRKVLTVTGRIDDLLMAKVPPADAACWVRAIVTDPGVVLDAKMRLQAVYPYVIEIEMRLEGTSVGPDGISVPDARRVSATEVVEMFWREATDAEPTTDERELLRAALSAVGFEEEASS